MIELTPSENDDPAFLTLAQKIVNGAIAILEMRQVYLVHIDNWFDHKWLGWWSSWEHKQLRKLYVPPFNPNRVRSQKHFIWNTKSSHWTLTGEEKPLHLWQPRGRRPSGARLLNRFSKSAAFIWFSGNTLINQAGSMMFYLSGEEVYAWYASFKKAENWTVADEFGITRRELASFEERGLQMEPADLPYGIRRFLTRVRYSCSEPAYTRFRQDMLRKLVRGVADAHENGWELLREGALAQLADRDPAMVVRALACLFVVGNATDAPGVEPFLSHPQDYVRKAARTCLFEIGKRPS